MKVLCALTASIAFASLSAIAGGISIAPYPGDTAPAIRPTFNVFGTCGDALVQIIGVNKEKWELGGRTFSLGEAGGVFALNNGKTISLKTSDHNSVTCVPIVDEKLISFRLIVGSTCGGSLCTDALNYIALDPKSMAIVSPAVCTIDCVSKIIKSNTLRELE
jgi:hypothetical protein